MGKNEESAAVEECTGGVGSPTLQRVGDTDPRASLVGGEAGKEDCGRDSKRTKRSRSPARGASASGSVSESKGGEKRESGSLMGIGTSACKGLIHPQQDDGDESGRSLSTVTRLPFLPVFEDRPPFETTKSLCEKDSSLLKALTHHRTPFAVIDTGTEDLKIDYASGGWVAGMGMPVESIEGTGFASILKKGIKASQVDIDRLEAAVRAQQVSPTRLVVCCSKALDRFFGFSLERDVFFFGVCLFMFVCVSVLCGLFQRVLAGLLITIFCTVLL